MRLSIKKLLPFLFAILIPATAFADNQPIRNENQATLRDLGSELTVGSNYAVDRRGNIFTRVTDPSSGLTQSVIPVSGAVDFNQTVVGNSTTFNVGTDTIEAASTATLLNLTAHGLRVGDIVIPTGGTAGNIGLEIPICQIMSANQVRLCKALAATPSTDAILIRRNSFFFMPKEDSGHTSGDAGVPMLGVNNRSYATFNTSNADYTPLAVGDVGNLYSTVVYDSTLTAAQSAVRPVDTSTISSNVGVTVLGRGDADWNPTASTGSGRFSMFSMDSIGRQYVNTGADVSKYTQGCNTAITTATTGDIIAALASNRHYISSISCTNTGAAATRVRIQDGSATGFADLMLAATTGYASITFPTPFRTSSNSAVVANVITTGSSTICCATGYSATR